MKREPLFIRFANGHTKPSDVVESVLKSIEDEKTKSIVLESREEIPDLSAFKKDFGKALEDLIDSGVNQHFINYVNSYMKPSLTEYVNDSSGSRGGESRSIVIKEKDTPWIEAIVCYNLCLHIKVYGISTIKRCSVCKKFFSHKGKYAKYCSDVCKSRGF